MIKQSAIQNVLFKWLALMTYQLFVVFAVTLQIKLKMSEWLAKLKKNRFLTFGLPFFVLIIGGSFGMKQFSQVRYDHRGQKTLKPHEIQELEKFRKPGKVSVHEEFEKIKKLDIDHWENKRGPRPWEPDNPTNLELQQRAAAAAANKS